MSMLGTKDLADLRETYLLANTPAYLFKHFRNSPIVMALADKHSMHQLLYGVRGATRTSAHRQDDLIEGYACLAAMTIKDPSAAIRMLRDERLGDGEWMAAIANHAIRTMTPETSLAWRVPTAFPAIRSEARESSFTLRASASSPSGTYTSASDDSNRSDHLRVPPVTKLEGDRR